MSNCPDPCSILRLQSFCKFHALAEHNRQGDSIHHIA